MGYYYHIILAQQVCDVGLSPSGHTPADVGRGGEGSQGRRGLFCTGVPFPATAFRIRC